MRLSKPRTVFADARIYATFPSVAMLSDGTFLLAFRAAYDDRYMQTIEPSVARQRHIHPRSQIWLLRLSEAGLPIGMPSPFPADLAAADQDPTLTSLPDGRVMLSSFAWQPIPERLVEELKSKGVVVGHEPTSGGAAVLWGTFTSVSADNGVTWSSRQYLAPAPGAGIASPWGREPGGGYVRGQLSTNKSGLLLMATYDRRSPQDTAFRTHLHKSTITGDWEYAGIIAEDKNCEIGYCEPALFRCLSGKLVAYMRTTNAKHRLAIARSEDDGATWTPAELTPLVGHPFAAAHGASRSWLFYGRRTARTPSVFGCPLDKDGQPVLSKEFLVRRGAAARDIGYPSVALRAGSGLLAYYWTDRLDVRRIVVHMIDDRPPPE